ncbi:urease accessory protein UreD [uncultured Litoreibacter sp.]|uniref:urease accessory protein UreD n=1 Tax=uncultured Litoreibacter sp. TaxID=1392394 RepID=UPI002607FF1B|nr:urease accessory protein UreD [uncultured Litoreibacter sp.]
MKLSAKLRGGRSALGDLRQSGSLRALFPRSASAALNAVTLNCAGGMTGGDRFDIAAEAEAGATLTLTTQAAERIYRATGQQTAHLRTRLCVAAGARINWLPQETILFDRSRFARRTDVELAGDASYLMVEPLIFGRTAMGEHLRSAQFNDRLRIYRDGRLLHADATRLLGDVETHLQGAAICRGGRAMASIVLVHCDAGNHLSAMRDMIGTNGGVSLKSPDLLVIRLIAESSNALRQIAIPIIARLSGADIPKPWTL